MRSRRPYWRHQWWHYWRRDCRCYCILFTIRYSLAVLCQWRLTAIPYDGNQYNNVATPVILRWRSIRYCTVHRAMEVDTVLYLQVLQYWYGCYRLLLPPSSRQSQTWHTIWSCRDWDCRKDKEVICWLYLCLYSYLINYCAMLCCKNLNLYLYRKLPVRTCCTPPRDVGTVRAQKRCMTVG